MSSLWTTCPGRFFNRTEDAWICTTTSNCLRRFWWFCHALLGGKQWIGSLTTSYLWRLLNQLLTMTTRPTRRWTHRAVFWTNILLWVASRCSRVPLTIWGLPISLHRIETSCLYRIIFHVEFVLLFPTIGIATSWHSLGTLKTFIIIITILRTLSACAWPVIVPAKGLNQLSVIIQFFYWLFFAKVINIFVFSIRLLGISNRGKWLNGFPSGYCSRWLLYIRLSGLPQISQNLLLTPLLLFLLHHLLLLYCQIRQLDLHLANLSFLQPNILILLLLALLNSL